MTYPFEVNLQNRKACYHFLKTLSLEQLNKIPPGFSNNIFWNIAHTVATQQGLVYGLSSLPTMVDGDFIAKYRKGTRPEADATEKDVEELKSLVFLTVEATEKDFNNGRFTEFKRYELSSIKSVLNSVEDAIHFNNFHEGLHLGYIMALNKAIK